MQIGHLKNIEVKLTEPIKMDVDMTLNDIALFVGPNGSGKTLMLKLIWLTSSMINSHGAMANSVNYDTDKAGTELFNGTFDDNDFTGHIQANFQRANITFEINDGEVSKSIITMDHEVDHFAMPIFMSKTMRTFDSIDQYLKFRQMIGIHGELSIKDAQRAEQLQKMYKIYDIQYVESLIAKTINGLEIQPQVLSSLHGFGGMEKYNIKHIKYDYPSNKMLWFDDQGEEHKFTTMSAGEQSLCNMVFAQAIQ